LLTSHVPLHCVAVVVVVVSAAVVVVAAAVVVVVSAAVVVVVAVVVTVVGGVHVGVLVRNPKFFTVQRQPSQTQFWPSNPHPPIEGHVIVLAGKVHTPIVQVPKIQFSAHPLAVIPKLLDVGHVPHDDPVVVGAGVVVGVVVVGAGVVVVAGDGHGKGCPSAPMHEQSVVVIVGHRGLMMLQPMFVEIPSYTQCAPV